MNNTKLFDALQYIRANGYSAVLENNTIIVEDPVFSCGTSTLVPAGHKLVNIHSFNSAIKFINDRS